MTTFASVARRDDIKPGLPLAATHGERKLVLLDDRGTLRAFDGQCPHAKAPLAKGAICSGKLICPFHKAEFDIHTGAMLAPPALAPLKQYPVRLEGDDVLVGDTPLPAPSGSEGGIGTGQHIVLAGAGAASLVAAQTLRENGFAGRITMIGPEAAPPYDRTALSKVVLAGDKPLDELPLLKPAAFFEDHAIDRVTASITRLDARHKRVELENGDALTYDAALLATGSRAAELDVPGADLPGVQMLRNRDDAAAIIDAIAANPEIAIVGGGFISIEAAASLRKRGLEVTLISSSPLPLANRFGDQVAGGIHHLLADKGVRFVTGEVIAFTGADRVDGVRVTGGHEVKAGLVLVATGARPVTEFLDGVEHDEQGGVVVSDRLLAADGLYAAGDVATAPLAATGKLARIEHWRVAEQHGRLAALNMLGRDLTLELVPFFWTFVAGKRFEYLGQAKDWDEIIVDGTPEEAKFTALVVKDGHVDAVIAAGNDTATARLLPHMNTRPDVATARAIMSGDRPH
ncbi:NADPH-dependent 2,4-dienoyl-CoA reductase/sulfur reductase-like enzyme/nitrite reductase/ring-hydroxylating ferredoxin subunit [Endobacter medicaginis]|uniref:FAD-dependent oxidoreductase n=1 Tax=Endobacter medicaginis TaxID=1181271 RepID=A0A839V3U7_9PROT|nr:FAD-dependent oxidoreductase [Endobacter medicaginis]MBB3174242.1 NADPH-dependent 2,4-dienoyl-CoA reductase/sulfur reductase-like enzyme/nitrite reductase/ring-hydroxylating ferredoxin subunit [Endobacter medicaginis]MCX5474286.1 FAD-dependent oxidoreductase [Endobacter medicaginis]NVN29074.1 FAD-dependent oxidoreductase [Endobacter medicaginis]